MAFKLHTKININRNVFRSIIRHVCMGTMYKINKAFFRDKDVSKYKCRSDLCEYLYAKIGSCMSTICFWV